MFKGNEQNKICRLRSFIRSDNKGSIVPQLDPVKNQQDWATIRPQVRDYKGVNWATIRPLVTNKKIGHIQLLVMDK